jgi:hypothetical protein
MAEDARVGTLPVVGFAALVADRSGRWWREIEAAPRMRGASVLKPLLFWVAAELRPFATDRQAWTEIARPAIVRSDNDATAELWSRVGEDRLLTEVEARAGVAWTTGGVGEHPSLRVMVTAGELAGAYAALASDNGVAAIQVRRWMREVPSDQAFGLRRIASDVLEVEEDVVGVKCGWFGLERAHAVVLVEVEDRILGAAVTTELRPDASRRAVARQASGDDARLVAAHDAVLGPTIRTSAAHALQAATEL